MYPAPPESGDPVILVVKERIKDLFKNLPFAIAAEEEPVHQIRVAARRLRVVLPLTAVRPNSRRVRRAVRVLRKVTRVAGVTRDHDVAVTLLPTALPRRAAESPAAKALLRRLRAARARARRRLGESLLDLDVAGLRKDLAKIVGRGGEDRFTAMMRIRMMREEESPALLEALAAIGRRFDPERLHALRAEVRRFRYAAEVGAALLGATTDAAKPFRRLQEVLGMIHDAWILAQWLGGQADLFERRGEAEHAAEARRLRVLFEDRSRAAHATFLESQPVEVLQKALSQVGRSLTVA